MVESYRCTIGKGFEPCLKQFKLFTGFLILFLLFSATGYDSRPPKVRVDRVFLKARPLSTRTSDGPNLMARRRVIFSDVVLLVKT